MLVAIEPDRAAGSSAAVVVGDVPLVHTEQVFARADATDANAAAADVIEKVRSILATAGSEPPKVVRWHFYVSDDAAVSAISKQLATLYASDYAPAVTFVTGKLAEPHSLIGADCVAVGEPAGSAVARQTQAATLPPTNKLYVSGDARPGELKAATLGTLEGLENTLKFAGLDWSHVVQLKTFLQPIDAVAEVRQVFRKFFGQRPIPVTTFVEWKSTSVPIEIELVAAATPTASTATVEFLTPTGMTGSPVFSRAARVQSPRTIYTSGIYGSDGAETATRVREVLIRLGELAKAVDSDLKHLVKATYYCSSNDSSTLLNKIRPDFYDPQRPPAASKAIVAGVGRPGHDLTLDMILVPTARASSELR